MLDDGDLLERLAIESFDDALAVEEGLLLEAEEHAATVRTKKRERPSIIYVYPLIPTVCEVSLEMDPDGYWGGVPRAWSMSAVPPRAIYAEPLLHLAYRCRDETTGWVRKHVERFARVVLVGAKDVITASSEHPEHGERLLRFDQRGFLALPQPRKT